MYRQLIARLWDFALPPELARSTEMDEAVLRARLAATGAFVISLMGLAAGTIHTSLGNPTRGLLPFALLPFGIAMLVWLRKGRSVFAAAQALLIVGLGVLVASPLLSEYDTPLLTGVVMMPFAACAMAGARSGLAWTIGCSAFLAAWTIATPYVGEEANIAWLLVVSTAAVGFGVVLTERTRERSLVARREALAEAKRHADELVRTESELVRTRALFEATFQKAPSLLIVASLETSRILYVNDAFVSLSGWSREESIGRTLSEMGAWPSESDRTQLAEQATSAGGVQSVEIQLRTRSGSLIWLLAGAEILQVEGTGYLLAQGTDITEKKHGEAEHARRREDLETAFAERGQQLQESIDALRRQERLSSIGTLASGIAHQINNPVGGIVAAAQFALLDRQERGERDETDAALETIVEEAKRCGQITRNILKFARNEPTARWPCDFRRIVQGAIESVRRPLEEIGAELKLDLCPGALIVRASPIDLEQVVVNLARNAAESRPGRVEIQISTHRIGGNALLEITDDGPGFSTSDRDRAFDPFFTSRVAEGGSGLGLSVVHSVVKDHGGQVDILDGEEGGARIRVAIPLFEED